MTGVGGGRERKVRLTAAKCLLLLHDYVKLRCFAGSLPQVGTVFIPSHTWHPGVARNPAPLSVDLVKHHIMNAIYYVQQKLSYVDY